MIVFDQQCLCVCNMSRAHCYLSEALCGPEMVVLSSYPTKACCGVCMEDLIMFSKTNMIKKMQFTITVALDKCHSKTAHRPR